VSCLRRKTCKREQLRRYPTELRDAIFTHPTAAEGLVGLFASPPSYPSLESSFQR
jgi:hypothetical protein